jgi:DNA polymerase I-like protein with 3'-5' exonuclease and polymerase domains
VNSVIQGSAADIIKLAMVKMAYVISKWKRKNDSDSISSRSRSSDTSTDSQIAAAKSPRLIMQIHDELLFECPANMKDITKLKELVIKCCSEECRTELQLSVPLALNMEYGLSWGKGGMKPLV